MSNKDRKIVILDAEDPDFPEKFREATDVTPTGAITVMTPQFHRTPDMPPPPSLPANDEEWAELKSMTVIEAKERGFGNWDGGLMLLPGEWYVHIPAWLEVECIGGEVSPWGSEERDNDIRCGCLAYGVRLGPPTDGEENE